MKRIKLVTTRLFVVAFLLCGLMTIPTPAAPGDLDPSFGNGGKVFTSIGKRDLYGSAVAVQADGKIVTAGSSKSVSSVDFALARFNADGSFDATFDGDGKVTTDFGGTHEGVRAIAIQTDGKIVAVGYAYGSGQSLFVLARYNSDGSLDTTFDGDGKVTTAFDNSSGGVRAIAIQSDGKIVAAGGVFALARYNADGSLDTTFDGDGKVITSFGIYGSASAVAIQADGKIVAIGAGYECDDDYCYLKFVLVARYNSDGSLDTGFSGDGKVTDDFGGVVSVTAVAIQSNGRIVVAGSAYNPDSDFFLAQYQSNSKAVFDFDGDGKSDISVFRTANGTWYLLQSTSGFTGFQFGVPTDKLVPADYDGDGKTDAAVYRPQDGAWYLRRSQSGVLRFETGEFNYIPQPADYDGDGKAEIAYWRPSDGVWSIHNLVTNQVTNFAFGQSGDVPVAADYDGDGKADVAVVRQSGGVSIWYVLGSTQGFYGLQFGTDTDKPVPADYDGDGKTDIAVFRPSNGVWYLLQSRDGFTGMQFGYETDLPVPADYDGDGKADVAVFRNGTWYLQRSRDGFTGVVFGYGTDKPVPNAFVP